jgi:hypothetical protein
VLIDWSVPACGLAVLACLRVARLDWTVGLALALLAAPLGVHPVIGCTLGALASRLTGRARRAALSAGIVIGMDGRLGSVTIPLPRESGSHVLIAGATGSGKTVTEALIVARAIERGHGAIVLDPKGDSLLREQAREEARRAGRPFREWTPAGPCAYNPYAHGSPSEIADKALAGERYSEPHYLRQAQRYLAHAARALAATGAPATPAALVELMDPRRLELAGRAMPDEREARRLFGYLDSLYARQRTGLTGTRDRLAILSESELGRWLEPAADVEVIDLLAAVRAREVVYFRLEADRLPLLARMLAAAIVSDLVTVAATCQAAAVPTVVAIDEFSAIVADGVARLFGRARAAGFSMVLATQELADLRAGGGELLEQVLGNVETVIAHRQAVPDSADLFARIAGTRPSWSTARQYDHRLPTGRSTRTASRAFAIHPDVIRSLARGTAAVSVAGGASCAVARIFHPGSTEGHHAR